MNASYLQTPIAYLKGVGPNRADALRSELGIHTYQDLLHLFPRKYIDRTQYFKIGQLQDTGAEVQIVGMLTHLKTVSQKKGNRLEATFEDETGSMKLVWFRGQKWMKERLKLGKKYVAFGRVNKFQQQFSMPHPELELLTEHEKKLRSGMQAVYPSTEKLSAKGVTNRAVINMVEQLFLGAKNEFQESLPKPLLEHLKLPTKKQALFAVHFPKNQQVLAAAQYRLKFEELFYIQLQLLRKNYQRKQKIKGYTFDRVGDYFNTFFKDHLPFDLTDAQKRVIKEIRNDMGSNAQMNRLLQGDVGSGKTIVAFMSMLIGLDNGFQACLMAPTEILSVQHYNGLLPWCKKLNISVYLLTGSTKASKRKEIHEKLENGELDLLIGTHAVLEKKVVFKNLGLAVIDEQHRFGVAQRAQLWKKNQRPPHILVMTATPIPRTLAMSLYGDLDLSVIDELPPGRKPVKTVLRSDANRLKMFAFLKDQIRLGRQVYIVYPLIQESEALDYKDLMDGHESISRSFPMPEFQISIVHGKMKPADKDYEMDRFVKGETQIMIATTVIEVGVNVPNASVMVIESAERFGLSQLHQLRGRVGRGADQSFCILMTGQKVSNEAKTRLETMCATNDGFEIAEVDLKLRGPGDLMGTQQSGILNLRIADVVRDRDILAMARSFAMELLKNDPNLEHPLNEPVRRTYIELAKYGNIWNFIS
ncbi:ATP-dependent DNA helicase RecG [Gilvibacter sediminis]|uniref:ATP-dependent DNA helicase RecG n=1 Tax=Gilvibacter sediminis TaxID=379071 RepID=UPI002350856D|nr:ATP-dependent DNA helicase RecG [Gilvibacter sediminis]MDC7997906.1 ATP-dependent DNA helicase RecG [Gilvibacter sediminis]